MVARNDLSAGCPSMRIGLKWPARIVGCGRFFPVFRGIGVAFLLCPVGLELWKLTDTQLTAGITEVAKVQAGIELLAAELTAAAEDRNLISLAGATSTTAWLTNLTGISRAEARRIVIRSESLSDLVEETRRAWAAGSLTSEKATIICTAITTLPDWVGVVERGKAESHLLELARSFWYSRGGPTDIDDGTPEIIPPKRIDPQQKPIRHNRFRNGP